MEMFIVIITITGAIISLIGFLIGIEVFMKSSGKLRLSSLFLILTILLLSMRSVGVFVGTTGAVIGFNELSFFKFYNVSVEITNIIFIILITLSLFFMKRMINEVENGYKRKK